MFTVVTTISGRRYTSPPCVVTRSLRNLSLTGTTALVHMRVVLTFPGVPGVWTPSPIGYSATERNDAVHVPPIIEIEPSHASNFI